MTTERHDTPPDLAATERALDRLGELDRAAAPASLEARAFEASREALARRARPAHTVSVVARIGPARLRVAAAAAILLVGAIAGSVALRSGRPGSPAVSGSGARGDARSAVAGVAPTDASLLERADEAVTLAFADASFSSLSGEIDAFSADPGAPLDSLDTLDSLDDASQEDSR